MPIKTIVYWVATGIVALELFAGGLMDLAHQQSLVDVMKHLGYPAYVMTILGFWKVPAAFVLLAPGLTRLKEWTYAGVLFELTGAIASHIFSGDQPTHLIAPLVFAILTAISWATRPQSRVLGDLWPQFTMPKSPIGQYRDQQSASLP